MQYAGGEAASPPAKRLRRPSVRLHQPYYEHQWKVTSKKPRSVKNVQPKSNGKGEEIEGDFNFDDNVAIGNWKGFNADFKRKRVRSSNSKDWGSEKSGKNVDLEIEKGSSTSSEDEKDLGGDGINNSPNCSFDNDGDDKLSDGNNNVGLNLKEGENGSLKNREEDVKMWLSKLGLGKYGRLFEVHGVDEQVLPFLTLEDLKEMGIVEVGSRRKMFSSIQKLRKGLL